MIPIAYICFCPFCFVYTVVDLLLSKEKESIVRCKNCRKEFVARLDDKFRKDEIKDSSKGDSLC
jgi:transposase-like protein